MTFPSSLLDLSGEPSPSCEVLLRSSGSVVGTLLVREAGNPLRWEIGYSVLPASRRLGYATELAGAAARWLFDRGARRVEIVTAVTNTASQRVAMRAGYRWDGALRGAAEDGADLVVLGRLATDSGEPVPPGIPLLAGPLTDGVVTMRPLTLSDAPAMLEIELDPESRQWSIFPAAPTAESVHASTGRAEADWLAGAVARFAYCDAATGSLAGTMALIPRGLPGLAMIGYDAHPAWRRRGYTVRALRLLTGWAFANGYARVELGTAESNTASRRTAERAGFTLEGTLPARLPNQSGGRFAEVRYGLIR